VLFFLAGTVLYQFSVGALGILLATFAGTMGQFGLLMIPMLIILMLLSGTTTPYESMPMWVQHAMEFTPATHFVSFAQSVLYRGAGFDIVWGDLAALATITVVFFGVSLMRFRTTIASFG
jgi:ABC-2 type transport system permease protein